QTGSGGYLMSTSSLAVAREQPSSAASEQTPAALPPPEPAKAREPIWLQRLLRLLATIGLGFINPVIRLCRGEQPRQQLRELWRQAGIPLLAIAVFLFAWSQASSRIQTSLGQIPGPIAVAQQAIGLWKDHRAEREKAAAFYERQQQRNAARLASNP